MKMIRNVIFDVGMVLVDFRWKEYMSDDLGFSPETVKLFGERIVINPLWDELDLGVRDKEDIFRKMREAVPGHESEVDRFFENIEGIVESYPYSKEWLKDLKARGYSVFLLSNYPGEFFALHEQTKFDFLNYVDGKVVSGFERVSKPDPEIYRRLLSRYSLKAEECIFLDDRKKNILAAKREGMEAILFTSYEESRLALDERLDR